MSSGGAAHDVLGTVPPSPQALDESVRTTTVRAWIALALVALVVVAVIVWSIVATIPREATATAVVADRAAVRDVAAGVTGSVVVTAGSGDHVSAGQEIARLTPSGAGASASAARPIVAPVAGRVRDVLVTEGQGVQATDSILSLDPAAPAPNGRLVTFQPESSAALYRPGATVTVTLVDPASGETRVVPARVDRVSQAPSPLTAMEVALQSPNLARSLQDDADGAAYRVDLTIDADALASTYRPVDGQIVEITNTYDRQHPIELLFGDAG